MCIAMTDPVTSWFETVELPATKVTSVIPTCKIGQGSNVTNKTKKPIVKNHWHKLAL